MKADRPSATALIIARSLALLARDPRTAPLVGPELGEASRAIFRATPGGRPYDRALGWSWWRSFHYAVERRTLPGIYLHYLVRKKYLEGVARRSLDHGIEQVVVLGAGFDTLAMRLHRDYPQASFLELDHPATQRLKVRAVRAACDPGNNIRFAPLELSHEPLQQAVSRSQVFRPEGRTLVIAEGLLMYFPETEVEALFRSVRLAAERFAFTFMESSGAGPPMFAGASPRVERWLRRKREPLLWGTTQRGLEDKLRAAGFERLEVATSADLRKLYLEGSALAGEPLATGESICVAE